MESMKIISGGQTGVDQGALDFAMEHGWPCGGWCPPGRESESGTIPAKYPVREVEGKNYDQRTLNNIRDADAILIITWNGVLEPGTALTMSECLDTGNTKLHVDFEVPATGQKDFSLHNDPVNQEVLSQQAGRVREWLARHTPSILNIAGNRESNSPGIQKFTLKFLKLIFSGGR